MLTNRPRLALLLALVAGALTPLAFAPWHLWPIQILSLALLFTLLLSASPRRALVFGYAYGLGFLGGGIHWLYESFGYNHVAIGPAVALTALLIALLSLYYGILGISTAWMMRKRPGVLLTVFSLASLLCVIEWLRGWLFTGFPWNQFGYAMIDTPLAGFAPITGVLGLTWLAAATAVLIAMFGLRRRGLWLATVSVTLAWAGGWLLNTVSWTTPLGETKSVALVQGNFSQDVKWRPDYRRPTLDTYYKLTAASGADLLVWPETAVPAFASEVDGYLRAVDALASTRRQTVLLGIPMVKPGTDSYYNAMLALGDAEGVFHKRHLVPFGEYLPLAGVLESLVTALKFPLAKFVPGSFDQPLLRGAGQQIAMSVCYEVIFAAELRRDLPAATVLVSASNDAWFGESIAAEQHLGMARMRAKETGRYLLRATNTGISAIIDVRGDITQRSPRFVRSVLSGEFQGYRGSTPYVRFGDWPLLVASLACLGLMTVRRVTD